LLFSLAQVQWGHILHSKKQVVNPVDKLPPATDTGANTPGCLVNGEAA